MRLEGQSKMGYYPTPDLQVKLIKTWLSGKNTRLLDPCAGRGEALAEIAWALPGSQTYGIELSDTRAAEAANVLDHVLNTGFEYAVLTGSTFSAVLLNPPYDGETETGSGTRVT
jgi:tRNA G46 methylase TrmB